MQLSLASGEALAPELPERRGVSGGKRGLKDAPAGRRKYAQYLSWLSEDEPRRKAMLFERMSDGWAHGSREFKLALIEDSKKELALVERGEPVGREAAELLWERELVDAMKALGKTSADARGDMKGADWKIAICAWMRRRRLARNAWLSDRLCMGVDASVSRGVRQLKEGDRPAASELLKRLEAKIKY